MKSQLLIDKIKTLKIQGPIKKCELVFVQNNPPQLVIQRSHIVDEKSKYVKAQSGAKSNLSESDLEAFSFEVTKANIHECLKENKQENNDFFRSIAKP
jgi:hypothetical protein